MGEAWRQATIDRFERVPVAERTALLRVTASSPERPNGDEVRPTLVADDGVSVSSFAAVPAPPDADGVLRAAFAVPVDVITGETVFSLEFPDFFVLALPAPVAGAARGSVAAAAAPPERREHLQPKLAELTEALGQTRQEAHELRSGAETARAQLLRVHVEAAVAAAELAAAQELDGLGATPVPRAADADHDATLLLRERDEALTRAESLALELGVERDRAESAEGERARAADQLDELQTWSAELERRLADTTTELGELRGTPGAELAEPISPPRPASRAELDQLRDGALREASAQAERDLAEAGDRPA